MTLVTDSDKSAGTFIIKNFSTYENTAFRISNQNDEKRIYFVYYLDFTCWLNI